jgi:steroid 5-alpha reductase family enzyme
LFYLLAINVKNNTLADIAWGSGIALIAITTLFVNSGGSMRQLIVTLLVLLWGARLSIYIYLRNRGKSEDFRYKKWREEWGKQWKLKSYLYVFLLQGMLMILVSLPVIYTNTYGIGAHGIFDRIGVLLWIVGFYFETVADWQLYQFKTRYKNKIMTQGLWK